MFFCLYFIFLKLSGSLLTLVNQFSGLVKKLRKIKTEQSASHLLSPDILLKSVIFRFRFFDPSC